MVGSLENGRAMGEGKLFVNCYKFIIGMERREMSGQLGYKERGYEREFEIRVNLENMECS